MAAQVVILCRYPRNSSFYGYMFVNLIWSIIMLWVAVADKGGYSATWCITAPIDSLWMVAMGVEAWLGPNKIDLWAYAVIVSVFTLAAFSIGRTSDGIAHQIIMGRGVVACCLAIGIVVLSAWKRSVSLHAWLVFVWCCAALVAGLAILKNAPKFHGNSVKESLQCVCLLTWAIAGERRMMYAGRV